MYCSESGPSNLYLARSCFSMCSGNFRSRSNGPPGIRRMRKKVIVMTQKRMTIKPRTLFATNLSMRSRSQESGVHKSPEIWGDEVQPSQNLHRMEADQSPSAGRKADISF